MIFLIKSDLPIETQNKIDAIEAIAAGQRTANQTAFLTALSPYLTNVIISIDEDDNILAASGLTVPTGYSGFAKGATFIKTDATGNGLYMNTGDATTAAWDLVDQASTTNIDDGAVTIPKLGANVVIGNAREVYVDKSRTDTYTANGNILTPYKTIKAAQDAINVTSATLLGSEALFDTSKFILHIAPGTYSDNLTIATAKYIRYDMKGVEISGTIDITQDQVGVTNYYGKVEFVGEPTVYAEKGRGSRISGAITFLKSAYDSLAYDNFVGVEITGAIKYGATAGTGFGTWILGLESCSLSATSSITTNFTAGSHCLLIQTNGFNEIKCPITGIVDLYDCNNTYFYGAINITPANGCIVKNSEFASTVSIVASKNLKIDANSYKSLMSRTPTLTGMTVIHIDEVVTDAIKAKNVTAACLADALDLHGKVVSIDDTVPVNAVAARGTLTVTGGGNDITNGMTLTLDTGANERVYTFKDTALTPTTGEVLVGANDTASLLNLLRAINNSGGTPGTDYSIVSEHPTVTAVSSNATTLIVADKVKGVAGNSIVFLKSGASLSIDGSGVLGGTTAGVDGTVGAKNQITSDATNLYLCTATNGIADANWKKLVLQAI